MIRYSKLPNGFCQTKGISSDKEGRKSSKPVVGGIELAPITEFFGSNSSGKSTILQFFLLLKQTIESSDRNRVLHTGDERSYEDNSFKEFPNVPQLEKFDPSDRKFVAVALTASDHPPIVNAGDRRSWAEFYEALTQCGVNLEFLCPDVIAVPGSGKPK